MSKFLKVIIIRLLWLETYIKVEVLIYLKTLSSKSILLIKNVGLPFRIDPPRFDPETDPKARQEPEQLFN